MREILFRGKRIDNGEWAEGLYCKIKTGHYTNIRTNIRFVEEYKDCIIKEFSDGGITWCEVIPETVFQYTGLTDKNGKKIFEGDIVECRARKDGYDKYKVVWCKDYADFRIEPLDFGVQFPIADYEGEYIQGAKYSVIGNIFNNPELTGDQS